jgi:hypothetical protein
MTPALRPALALVLLLTIAASAPQGDSDSFDMRVPVPPVPVAIGGERRLVYELHLANFAKVPLVPTSLAIESDKGVPLARFDGQALASRVSVLGVEGAKNPSLAPGAHAVIYIEIPIGAARPAGIRHILGYARAGTTLAVSGASAALGVPARLALGSPLQGGPWVAIHGYAWERGHRRVFYALDGVARVPGRFAVDFVKLDDEGRIARGNPDLPGNALGYGTPVLAVADARVAAMRDGMPESATVSGNPSHPGNEAAGNYLALALGDGRYAIYEHLRPGSITVGPGDRVRRGQRIAQLGFTGDSTGPHLHFHLADAAIPLHGEGLPYGFACFTVIGGYRDIGDLGTKPWAIRSTAIRRGAMPDQNDVIHFDQSCPGARPWQTKP